MTTLRKPDITILFSTFNRAFYLRQTLEAMSRLDLDGLEVEFVVVNNNSTDDTETVLQDFQDRMPLRTLFESRPGKNCALNYALDRVELGRIVVFCDDDIEPKIDWLQVIVASCREWPDHKVFGGRIESVWPEGVDIPDWAYLDTMNFVFSPHDRGDKAHIYPADSYPGGANFWVKCDVFADGRRFDETRGPQAGVQYKMGSETSFLSNLSVDGYEIVYIPDSRVGHHIQPSLLSEDAALKRAFRFGLSKAHRIELPRQDLLAKHPTLWRLLRRISIGKETIKFGLARISLPKKKRFTRSIDANTWRAIAIETLNIGRTIDSKRSVD